MTGDPIKTKPWDRVEVTPQAIVVTSKITGRSTVYPTDSPQLNVYEQKSEGGE